MSSSPQQTPQKDLDTLRACLREASRLAQQRRHSRALAIIEEVLRDHPAADAEIALKELRDLASAITKQRRRQFQRILVLTTFLASALVVGALQFTHVPSAEVVVDVQTRGALFTLTKDASLHSGQLSAVLPGAGAELTTTSPELRLLTPVGRSTSPLKSDPLTPVVIRPAPGANAPISLLGSNLRLERFDLQPEVPVEVRTDGRPQSTVTVRHNAASTVEIGTGESVIVGCNNCELHQNDVLLARIAAGLKLVPDPREITVRGSTRRTDLGLVFPAKVDTETVNQNLRLAAIDFTTLEAGTPESLIQKGTVRIVDLNDKRLPLSEHDFLVLGDIADQGLVLTRFALGQSLEMRFQGRVGVLRTGVGGSLHSRIPTRLEWVAANKPLSLFIAAVSAIFGFLAAAVARFGIFGSD